MEIIITNKINEARKEIDSKASKNEQVVILSQDDEFNRKLFENKKIDLIVINEDLDIRDYMKQRNSQLNEVLCKLAVKNNIKIGIDIAKIIIKSDVEKARALGRLKQNINLCKRTNCKLICLPTKNKTIPTRPYLIIKRIA